MILLDIFFVFNFIVLALSMYLIYKVGGRLFLPMAWPLLLLSLCLILGSGINLLDHLWNYSAKQILLSDIGFTGWVFVPALWLWIMSEFLYERKLKVMTLFLIEPIVIVIFYWTNDYHQLISTEVITKEIGDITRVSRNFGPLRLVHGVYQAVLWNLSSLWISWKLWKKDRNNLGLAIVLFLCVQLLQVLFWMSLKIETPVRLGAPFFIIFLVWGIHFLKLLDVMPIARKFLVDKIEDGVLVLNKFNFLVFANTTARRWFMLPDNIDNGRHHLLPELILDAFEWREGSESQLSKFSLPINRDQDIEVEATMTNIVGERGDAGGKIIQIKDVTQRNEIDRRRIFYTTQLEKTKSKLEELDRLKGNFFANVTHEFRTPLTLLAAPLGQLKEQYPADLQYQRMHRNAQRLLSLVNQLLQVNKLDEVKVEVKLSLVRAKTFFTSLFSSFNSLAEQKRIQYATHIDVPSEIVIDREKLESIVVNLLSNAFKFTQSHGKVSVFVSVNAIKNLLELKIADTGIGIAKDDVQSVFNRFYQSERTDAIGTGIGLSLVKQLVELMGGQVVLESKLAIGSTFKISIPLDPEIDLYRIDSKVHKTNYYIQNVNDKGESKKSMPAKHKVLATDKQSVLVVEDETDISNYLREILEEDYEVIISENGEKGIQYAIEHIPDLIITDIIMPKMNGYQVLERLQQDLRTGHIPVIMLTAKGDQESKLRGLARGADAYVLKPFDVKELKLRVSQLLQKRKLRQAHYAKHLNAPDTTAKDNLQLASSEKLFLKNIKDILEKNLTDSSWGVPELSQEIHLSRSQLHRKLTALIGKSPSVLIKETRLGHALQLIESKRYSIKEVSMKSGFGSQSYFSTQFKKHFGKSPKEMM